MTPGPKLVVDNSQQEDPAEFQARMVDLFGIEPWPVVVSFSPAYGRRHVVLYGAEPGHVIATLERVTGHGPGAFTFLADDTAPDPARRCWAIVGDLKLARIDGLGPEHEGLIPIQALADVAATIPAIRTLANPAAAKAVRRLAH